VSASACSSADDAAGVASGTAGPGAVTVFDEVLGFHDPSFMEEAPHGGGAGVVGNSGISEPPPHRSCMQVGTEVGAWR
jgi:hypothetical protein